MSKNGSMKADDPNNPMAAKVNECLREMMTEKQQLDQSKTPHAARLLDQGNCGRKLEVVNYNKN